MKYRVKRSPTTRIEEIYKAVKFYNGDIVNQLGEYKYIIRCSPKILTLLILKYGLEKLNNEKV